MDWSNLKFSVRVFIHVENCVCCRYKDSNGPLSLVLNMSSLIAGSKISHYMLNRIVMAP